MSEKDKPKLTESKKVVVLKVLPATNKTSLLSEAIDLFKRDGVPVEFTFNGDKFRIDASTVGGYQKELQIRQKDLQIRQNNSILEPQGRDRIDRLIQKTIDLGRQVYNLAEKNTLQTVHLEDSSFVLTSELLFRAKNTYQDALKRATNAGFSEQDALDFAHYQVGADFLS